MSHLSISSFNRILTFLGYFKPKLSLLKESSVIFNPLQAGVVKVFIYLPIVLVQK